MNDTKRTRKEGTHINANLLSNFVKKSCTGEPLKKCYILRTFLPEISQHREGCFCNQNTFWGRTFPISSTKATSTLFNELHSGDFSMSATQFFLYTLSRVKDYLRIDHYGCLLQWTELGKDVVQLGLGGINA